MALGTASVRRMVKSLVFDHAPRVLSRGPADRKRVAITFDDGPDGDTPRYLDLMESLGIPGTFFLLGDRADAHPDLVREYVRRGHQIASHGYDHQRFTALGVLALLDQCKRTEAALGTQLTGRPWVRPPHGSLGATSIVSLLGAGYTLAMWSLDSCDYGEKSPDALVARCAPERVRPGEVLLFHEGQEWTLAALPRIVKNLQAAGYECVTMQDLFAT